MVFWVGNTLRPIDVSIGKADNSEVDGEYRKRQNKNTMLYKELESLPIL